MNNFLTLISPYINKDAALTTSALKQAYVEYLKTIQPDCPYMDHDELFIANEEAEQAFEKYFAPEVRVPEASLPYEPAIILYANPDERKNALQRGLDRIQKVDATFARLFQLMMNTVFCTHSKRLGGTSVNPRYIGVMCAYYDMTAEEEALPELLIHEFTHNALFLDELRYGHYNDYDELQNPATYIHSNYLGMPIKLPFDRCLHSLIVSAEVIMARDAYIGHKPRISQHLTSEQIIKRARNYIEQLHANKAVDALMTSRCREILDKCTQFFSRDDLMVD